MTTDWIATLREQGVLAERVAATMTRAHADPNLTLDQASRIYRIVEQGAQDFDQIVEEMDDHDLDDTLYDAAEALEDIWSNLSVAAANKVRTIQGLAAIKIRDDLEDDEE